MSPKPTLLVVEDDQSIRESLCELLESERYSVLLAENGHQALEILAGEEGVGLILLDLTMPIMDGRTFLQEFPIHFPDLKSLPIVIMTAAGRSEIPEHPPEWILRKPLEVDSLMELLARLVPVEPPLREAR